MGKTEKGEKANTKGKARDEIIMKLLDAGWQGEGAEFTIAEHFSEWGPADNEAVMALFVDILAQLSPQAILVMGDGCRPTYDEAKEKATAVYFPTWHEDESTNTKTPVSVIIDMPKAPFLPPVKCTIRSGSTAHHETSPSAVISQFPDHLSWHLQPQVEPLVRSSNAFHCGDLYRKEEPSLESADVECKSINTVSAKDNATKIRDHVGDYLSQLYAADGTVRIVFGIHDKGWVQGLREGTADELVRAIGKLGGIVPHKQAVACFPHAGDVRATITVHDVLPPEVGHQQHLVRFTSTKTAPAHSHASKYHNGNAAWPCCNNSDVLLVKEAPKGVTNSAVVSEKEFKSLHADLVKKKEVIVVELSLPKRQEASYWRFCPLSSFAKPAIVERWAKQHRRTHVGNVRWRIGCTGIAFELGVSNVLPQMRYTVCTLQSMSSGDVEDKIDAHLDEYHLDDTDEPLRVFCNVPKEADSSGLDKLSDALAMVFKKYKKVLGVICCDGATTLVETMSFLGESRNVDDNFLAVSLSCTAFSNILPTQPSERCNCSLDDTEHIALMTKYGSFTELLPAPPLDLETCAASRPARYLKSLLHDDARDGLLFDSSAADSVVVRRRFTDDVKDCVQQLLTTVSSGTMKFVGAGKKARLDGSTTSLGIGITDAIKEMRRNGEAAIGFLDVKPPTDPPDRKWLATFIENIPNRFDSVVITISDASFIFANHQQQYLSSKERRALVILDYVGAPETNCGREILPEQHGCLNFDENCAMRTRYSMYVKDAFPKSLDGLMKYAKKEELIWLGLWPITAFREEFQPVQEIVSSLWSTFGHEPQTRPSLVSVLLIGAFQAFVDDFKWPLPTTGFRASFKQHIDPKHREALSGILNSKTLRFFHPYIAQQVFCKGVTILFDNRTNVAAFLLRTVTGMVAGSECREALKPWASTVITKLLFSTSKSRKKLHIFIPPFYYSLLSDAVAASTLCERVVTELKRMDQFDVDFIGIDFALKLAIARAEGLWSQTLLEQAQENSGQACAVSKTALDRIEELCETKGDASPDAIRHRSILLSFHLLCLRATEAEQSVLTATDIALQGARASCAQNKDDETRFDEEDHRFQDFQKGKLRPYYTHGVQNLEWKTQLWGDWEGIFAEESMPSSLTSTIPAHADRTPSADSSPSSHAGQGCSPHKSLTQEEAPPSNPYEDLHKEGTLRYDTPPSSPM